MPNTYTITWNSTGGSAVEPSTKTYDSTLGTLPISTKENYSLNGWYTSASGGEQISSDTRVRGNATYYA